MESLIEQSGSTDGEYEMADVGTAVGESAEARVPEAG